MSTMQVIMIIYICGVIVGNSGLNNMNIQSDSAVPVQVYCVDANHCPGAVCIIFTLPNGKVRIYICISYVVISTGNVCIYIVQFNDILL